MYKTCVRCMVSLEPLLDGVDCIEILAFRFIEVKYPVNIIVYNVVQNCIKCIYFNTEALYLNAYMAKYNFGKIVKNIRCTCITFS